MNIYSNNKLKYNFTIWNIFLRDNLKFEVNNKSFKYVFVYSQDKWKFIEIAV